MKYLAALLVIVSVLTTSCKKEEPAPVVTTPAGNGGSGGPSVVLAEVSGYPGTILSIETNILLNDAVYYGDLDANTIEIYKAGEDLSFGIPNVSPGTYELTTTIEGEDYTFNLEVLQPTTIADPTQYITDFMAESDAASLEYDALIDSLINEGIIDPVVAANDAAIWSNIENQAQIEYANMTASQKAELAAFLEANKEWLDKLTYYSPNTYLGTRATYACEALRQQGLNETSLFKRLAIAVEYKLCQQTAWGNDAEIGSSPSKAVAAIEMPYNWYATNTLTDLIGGKIERLTKEISNISTSKHVGQDGEGMEERATLIFDDEVEKSVYAKVRMRTPRASDAGQSSSLGSFASMFQSYSSSYNDFANSVDENLEWRPEFGTDSKVVNFNHFMSVTFIDNSNVRLNSSRMQGDDWLISFRNEGNTQETFNYTISYNDGDQSFNKSYSAKVNATIDSLEWLPGGSPEESWGSFSGDWQNPDGDIVLLWQGGLAPYRVSLDGGSTWMSAGDHSGGNPDPTEDIFYIDNQFPGVYNVVLEDDLGNQLTGVAEISF